MESAHISGMYPSGTTSKKQQQGVTASNTLSALIHFPCRRSKGKYFINRSFITVCCSREKCTLTYSWNGVLPAYTPWNKQHSTTTRMKNSVCSRKTQGCWSGQAVITYWNSPQIKTILLLEVHHLSILVLSSSCIFAKAFSSDDVFVSQLPKWTLYSVCLRRMPLLMVFDASWRPLQLL